MEKVKRKLTDKNGNTKTRTVWKCRAKIGTTSSTTAYFFDKPEVGKLTECVEEASDKMYRTATSVYIDEVSEINMVFCSKF